MRADKPNRACPLCAGTKATNIEAIHYERIWAALSEDSRATFGQEVIHRHTPAPATGLVECRTCGLQYFTPAIPGDHEFYRQLTTTTGSYYNEEKWDFKLARKLVKPGDRILDVACGSGAWLQQARQGGALVCGVDTNPAAVASARVAGLEAHCQPLEEFAIVNQGRFDVVTAFQIVEHLPEVRSFVIAAALCLRPGGTLIVTVPNRHRVVRAAFEPLDHPPHHMSRWSGEQFSILAQRCDLRLCNIYYERASMPECRARLRQRIASAAQAQSLWSRAVGRLVFAPTLYALYQRTGLLDYWQMWRLSMMAVYRTPS